MRLRLNVVPIVVTVAVLAGMTGVKAAAAKEGAATSPLEGTWSVTKMTSAAGATIDPSQPGVFMFGRSHYSAVYTLGAEPRPAAATPFSPTTEETVAQFQRLIVNTGTYEIAGSTITFRPLVAKSPEFIGGHSTMDYQVNGDVLTLTTKTVVAANGSTPAGVGGTITLRRLE